MRNPANKQTNRQTNKHTKVIAISRYSRDKDDIGSECSPDIVFMDFKQFPTYGSLTVERKKYFQVHKVSPFLSLSEKLWKHENKGQRF